MQRRWHSEFLSTWKIKSSVLTFSEVSSIDIIEFDDDYLIFNSDFANELESPNQDDKYESVSIIDKCFFQTKGKETTFSFNIIFSSNCYEIRFQ